MVVDLARRRAGTDARADHGAVRTWPAARRAWRC